MALLFGYRCHEFNDVLSFEISWSRRASLIDRTRFKYFRSGDRRDRPPPSVGGRASVPSRYRARHWNVSECP